MVNKPWGGGGGIGIMKGENPIGGGSGITFIGDGNLATIYNYNPQPNIKLKILDSRIENSLPEFQTPGSAAMDLRVCEWEGFAYELDPGESILVGTGLAIYIEDPNIAAMLLPRSGLGHNKGIVLGNLVGLLDSDYQNEVQISVWNRSHEPFTIHEGDRICQIMFVPILRPTFEIVEEFDKSDRGLRGWGSTGKD